jgi:uncharacterized protein involved in exopolysaccharide biosynthesis
MLAAGCDRAKQKPRQVAESSSAAIGKLIVRPPAGVAAGASGSKAEELFYEKQIGILSSPDIRQKAEAAVLRSKPALKIEPVAIQVVREQNGSVLSVIGRSTSSEFARALVDEIMDAFVATKARDKTGDGDESSTQLAAARKELSEAERAWASYKLDHDTGRLASDRSDAERLVRRFEVSLKWFQTEVEAVSKLSVEDDIKRRQTAGNLPAEMPAEFALTARVSPTMGELGYLSAMKSANDAAIRAAKDSATKDRESRVETLRKQIELLGELLADSKKKLAELSDSSSKAADLQGRLTAAEQKVQTITKQEQSDALKGAETQSPGAASIVERATPWNR